MCASCQTIKQRAHDAKFDNDKISRPLPDSGRQLLQMPLDSSKLPKISTKNSMLLPISFKDR